MSKDRIISMIRISRLIGVVVRRSWIVEIGLDLAAVITIVDELNPVPKPVPNDSAGDRVRLDFYVASRQSEAVDGQRLGGVAREILLRNHHGVIACSTVESLRDLS